MPLSPSLSAVMPFWWHEDNCHWKYFKFNYPVSSKLSLCQEHYYYYYFNHVLVSTYLSMPHVPIFWYESVLHFLVKNDSLKNISLKISVECSDKECKCYKNILWIKSVNFLPSYLFLNFFCFFNFSVFLYVTLFFYFFLFVFSLFSMFFSAFSIFCFSLYNTFFYFSYMFFSVFSICFFLFFSIFCFSL